MCIILWLFKNTLYRQLCSYSDTLRQITGTLVSTDTAWRLIEFRFVYKGPILKPNLIPRDTFEPANQVKSFKYITTLLYLQPFEVVFADKTYLKGEEVFSKKVRTHPLTRATPVMLTNSGFTRPL